MSNHVSNIQYLYNWPDGQKVLLPSSLNFHFVANAIPVFEGWEFPGCSSTTGRNPGEGWVEEKLPRVWEFKIATIWTKDQKRKELLKDRILEICRRSLEFSSPLIGWCMWRYESSLGKTNTQKGWKTLLRVPTGPETTGTLFLQLFSGWKEKKKKNYP